MLTIDIGNSRIKWALFQGNEVSRYRALEYNRENFRAVIESENLPLSGNAVLISHVGSQQNKLELIDYLKSRQCNDFVFARTQLEQCQVKNSYLEVSNMGVDRWLAMLAAYHSPGRQKGNAVCVIDCGTAITVDVVSDEGVHLGGLIMPGIKTQYMSLMKTTSGIEQAVAAQEDQSDGALLGTSTAACVQLGCSQLVENGVSAILARLIKSHLGRLDCLVAGGDGEALIKGLGVDAIYSPYLVLEGLRLTTKAPQE